MASSGHLDFDGLLGERRRVARAELAAAMRSLSLENDPDSAGSVRMATASAYHEPRLYCQLAQHGLHSVTLAQLLFSADPGASDACAAITDGAGLAHFPGFGSCATGYAEARITVRYSAGREAFIVNEGTTEERWCGLEPSIFLPDTRIVVTRRADTVLAAFLESHVESPAELAVVDDPQRYVPDMSRALSFIGAVAPAFHDVLVESVREILLFRHPRAESFAALGMHGMLFLNVPPAADAGYFVAELTHQGGHVLFSEATLRRHDFFRTDPDTPLSGFLGRDDGRSVYDAFHGLYTEHMESQIVLALLRDGPPTTEERVGLRRHLTAVAARHARDLALTRPHAHEIFSPPGREIYDQFQESHRRLVGEHPGLPGAAGHPHVRVGQ